jgi:hypothetical protein
LWHTQISKFIKIEKGLRHLPRSPLVNLTNLFNHCLRLSHFPKPWKEAKIITLSKPGKDPNFLTNYARLASCLQKVSYLKKLFWK